MSNHRRFLRPLNLTADAEMKLSRVLTSTEKGSDTILLTPMAERVGADLILSGWDKIYNSNSAILEDNLLALEDRSRSKYGPRSIAVPWAERKDSVYNYYEWSSDNVIENKFNLGNRCRPLSAENTLQYLKNSTSSGLPFMQKKALVKPVLLANLTSLLERRDPCVLYTRTQESKKTRTVWGYPIADTLQEMRFYRPLLEYQSRQDWRSAVTTPERVDDLIIEIMKRATANNLFLVSVDFSSYDASVKRNLIESAFGYIKSLFQVSYHKELDEICERMITIGIVTPDGILTGDHGVPSGSTFTNEVDSIVQFLIASEYGEDLNGGQIQGDDGVYAVKYPEKLLDHFTSYGLNVNRDKSDISNFYCLFLQKYYSMGYINSGVKGGIFPTYRALCRLVYPERYVEFKEDLSGKDYYAIRTLTILENCKHHPLFSKFIDYIMSLDKYPLIPSSEGLLGYVKFRNKQDGKDVNFNKHNYGDSTSIKDFESYKYIKAKM